MKIQMHLGPSFGHWLAGFIDGEATFAIDKVGSRHQCRMALSVRSDDRQVIEMIRERTGIGTVYSWKTLKHPAIKWSVSSRSDCAQLVQILGKFPLRSKKLRDFETWAQAVALMQLPAEERDEEKLQLLKQELQSGRKFM